MVMWLYGWEPLILGHHVANRIAYTPFLVGGLNLVPNFQK